MANMSDSYFLDRVARAYPHNQIEIIVEGEKTILQVGGIQYEYGSLSECIAAAKDNFCSMWISHIHEINNPE